MSDSDTRSDACYLPAVWDDDKRMNSFFLDFRHRSVNPTDYEAKMSFWKRLVTDWVKVTDVKMIISMEDIEQAFVRKGRIPRCLRTVVRDVARDGIIMSMDDFLKQTSKSSWLSWSVDMLLRRPLAYMWATIYSRGDSADVKNERFIILDKLKDATDNVRCKHTALVELGMESNAILFETLHDHCVDITTSKHDLELCILWLQKEGLVSIHFEQQQKIVKFMDMTVKGDSGELDEKEKAIIQLKSVRKDIDASIANQHSNINKYSQEVSNHLKLGARQLAKSALQKRKQAEKRLLEKEGVLENVDRLIYQLEDVSTQKVILNALHKGTEAMKLNADVNIKRVEDIMAAVSETIEQQQGIQEALASSFDDNFDLSTLEDELNLIMAEDLEEDDHKVTNATSSEQFSTKIVSNEPICESFPEVRDLPSPPSSPVTIYKSSTIKDSAGVLLEY